MAISKRSPRPAFSIAPRTEGSFFPMTRCTWTSCCAPLERWGTSWSRLCAILLRPRLRLLSWNRRRRRIRISAFLYIGNRHCQREYWDRAWEQRLGVGLSDRFTDRWFSSCTDMGYWLKRVPRGGRLVD